jgi:outer membrane protein
MSPRLSLLTLALLPPLMLPLGAAAGPDVLVDLLAIPGSAGLGAIERLAYTPYKGAAVNTDLIPLYMYEGKRYYVHATRVGIKLSETERSGFDAFLDYRYEGFPIENTPAILAGMARRNAGVDAGVAYRHRAGWGNVDVELLHDINNTSHGSEFRLGYNVDFASGDFHWRPNITVARRNATLNNYYYGVRLNEATAQRPAYQPGSGVDVSVGLYGYYDLTQRWRLLGSLGATKLARSERASPIVEDKLQPSAMVGLAYDFGSHAPYSAPGLPLIVRVSGGRATECNFLNAATFRCGSTRTGDDTRIWGVDVGRPLVQGVNGWPLDFVAMLGVLVHDERGIVPDGLQLNAQIKAYYYGLPFHERLGARVGFGAGFSLAQRVPLTEVRDQARRGRDTSRLLNYLDPTLDVSVGRITGAHKYDQTYLGIGISHRSGIFGASQLLGNINGGSNYLYAYLEAKL